MATTLTQSKLQQMIGTAEYAKVVPANASYDVHHVWAYLLLLRWDIACSLSN